LALNTKRRKNHEAVIEIDKLLHEPARLKIMSKIYNLDSLDFLLLKKQTGLSSGNLSAHLTKLEKAGYLNIEKEFHGRRPHTTLKITKKGRDAFSSYKKKIISVFEDNPE
jgi:DNA-binding MarR family transcriptional regulator